MTGVELWREFLRYRSFAVVLAAVLIGAYWLFFQRPEKKRIEASLPNVGAEGALGAHVDLCPQDPYAWGWPCDAGRRRTAPAHSRARVSKTGVKYLDIAHPVALCRYSIQDGPLANVGGDAPCVPLTER
jgi:hypothetical protein